MKRIAVFRALQLGDLLVAVPAFRALRQHFPDAEITLIGLPWAASFVQRFSCYIDRFVEFVGYPGIDEVRYDEQRTARFLDEQRAYSYDVVLQMHGSGRASNPFVLALGASCSVGYYGKVTPGLTIEAVYPDDQHEIWRNLHLVEMVVRMVPMGTGGYDGRPQGDYPTIHGIGRCDGRPQGDYPTIHNGHSRVVSLWASVPSLAKLEFPLFEKDYDEADALLRPFLQRGKRIIGIHPGARPPARRWPAEYFALVADSLAQQFDAQVVLTGGPGEEQTVQAVIGAMCMPALSLVGKTSLGGLAALMKRFDLFISNDTGPAHIACAVDCRSITIFGPADVRRWAPLDRERHPIVRHPVACSPCGYWECPIDHRCLRWLSPDGVLTKAREMMQKEHIQQCNI